MTNVLTEDELKRITGACKRKSMVAWLEENRIPYLLAMSGWPRVHAKAIEHALGVGDNNISGPGADFDFASLR